MSGASLAVQKALHAALAAVPALGGVYDGVPAGALPPYVTLGPDVVTDWSTKTRAGREHRVALSVWDDRDGSARVKAQLALVEDAVLALAGVHDGHRIADVRFVRGFISKDADGWTQGVGEFRIRTEQL